MTTASAPNGSCQISEPLRFVGDKIYVCVSSNQWTAITSSGSGTPLRIVSRGDLGSMFALGFIVAVALGLIFVGHFELRRRT